MRVISVSCNRLHHPDKLYPEKWTWILQLPMFVDSETVV